MGMMVGRRVSVFGGGSGQLKGGPDLGCCLGLKQLGAGLGVPYCLLPQALCDCY